MKRPKKWTPAKCPKDCIYRGAEYAPGLAGCNYLSATGELRRCDPGRGCTRYARKGTGQRKPRRIESEIVLGHPSGRAKRCAWDNQKGYALWQEGQTVRQIAEKLKISRSAVQERKKRCWEHGKP